MSITRATTIIATAILVLAVTAGPRSADAAAGLAVTGCGTQHIFRITGSIQATGISCARARTVFRVVERAPLPSDVASTPYFQYSPSYSVKTPYGRFSCRREPHGLGGSEHNIRCRRGAMRVNWNTIHD